MNYPRHPNYMGFHDTRPAYYSDSESDSGWEPSNLYSSNRAHGGRFPSPYGRPALLPRLPHENLRNSFNNPNQYGYEAYGGRPAAYGYGGRTYSNYNPEPPLYGRPPTKFDSYNDFGPRDRDAWRAPTGSLYSDGGFSDDISGYGGANDSIDDRLPSRDGTFYRPGGARGFGGGVGMGGGAGMGSYGGRGGRNAMAPPLDLDGFRREPESVPGRYPGARFDPDAFPRRNPLEGGSWGARGVLRPDEIEEA